MKGLDFWATDAWTDSGRPVFDDWSVQFMLREWQREQMGDEVMLAFEKMYRNQVEVTP